MIKSNNLIQKNLLHKKVLKFIILALTLACLIYYLISNYESFEIISFKNLQLLPIIGIAIILGYIPIAIITYYLLVPLGIKLEKKESFGLAIITGFYNLITPFRGGMAARAVYLKKKYGFSYVNFLATLAASYVLTFFIAALLGLIGVLSIYLATGMISWIILLIFGSIFTILLIVIIFSPKIPQTRYLWVNRFINVINGWHIIKNNKKIILVVSLMSLVQILLSSINMYLQFKVFGISITLRAAILLSAMGALSMIIGITPAGLGITEAIIVFSASTLGITPAESLAAALVGRFVSFIVLFILGPIFSYILLKKNERIN